MTESEWLAYDDLVGMIRLAQYKDYARYMSDRKLRLFACACCRAVWGGVPCGKCSGSGWIRVNAGLKPEPGGASGYEWKRVDCPGCRGSGKVGGLTDPRSRRAVEVAERYADGLATEKEVEDARGKAREVRCSEPQCIPCMATECLNKQPWLTFSRNTWATDHVTPARMAALLRDIVGNPFRRVTLPSPDVQCPNCFGKGSVREDGPYTSRYGRVKCGRCSGGGKVRGFCPWLTWRDGTVPKLARAIYDARDFGQLPTLADALEEAGCPAEEACGRCGGKGGRMLNSTDAVRSAPGECPVCGLSGRVPNQLLEHLRGPGPHALGCWALDLCAWAAHAPEEID